MFRKRKPQTIHSYDLTLYTPVLHCSICTGEQTAGFRENRTGKFYEIMLIRNEADLKKFKGLYGVDELKKEY